MGPDGIKILVCVPVLNEAENIESIIIKSKKYAGEVVVYDDGSTDETYNLAVSAGLE
jgi:glycosyltransferase involved in cell wall biosynthesis